MAESIDDVKTLADLRCYVHHTLCRRENLVAEQFPLFEARLKRGSRDCGLRFALHGPRSVHLSAVFAAEKNTLYFYGTRGERFLKVGLTQQFAWN